MHLNYACAMFLQTAAKHYNYATSPSDRIDYRKIGPSSYDNQPARPILFMKHLARDKIESPAPVSVRADFETIKRADVEMTVS